MIFFQRLSLLSIAFIALSACTTHTTPTQIPMTQAYLDQIDIPADASVATFAGGCFWCIEQAFQGQDGVYEAISGYSGGDESDATYDLVSSGQTDHREAAQVYYNPDVISYSDLLAIFWRQIDPTDDGGQFADRGFHYTTAIYAHDDTQEQLATQSLDDLEESEKYKDPIVTDVIPYVNFFPAEEEHQNFAQKRSEYYQRYKKGSGRADFIEDNWEE